MKTLLIYDSLFGNTEKIANAMAMALKLQPNVNCLKINEVKQEHLQEVTHLIIGSPTRGFMPSPEINNFLKALPDNKLEGLKIAAFDTRVHLSVIKYKIFRFMVDKGGYAANTILKHLIRKGGKKVCEAEGFYVLGEQGPLMEGEMERAAIWAEKIISS
jgi:flavodoxin